MDLQALKNKRFAVVRRLRSRVDAELVLLFGAKSCVYDELSLPLIVEDGYEIFDVVLVWDMLEQINANALQYTIRRLQEAARELLVVRTLSPSVETLLDALGFEKDEERNLMFRRTT